MRAILLQKVDIIKANLCDKGFIMMPVKKSNLKDPSLYLRLSHWLSQSREIVRRRDAADCCACLRNCAAKQIHIWQN